MPCGVFEVEILDRDTGEAHWIRVSAESRQGAAAQVSSLGELVARVRLVAICDQPPLNDATTHGMTVREAMPVAPAASSEPLFEAPLPTPADMPNALHTNTPTAEATPGVRAAAQAPASVPAAGGVGRPNPRQAVDAKPASASFSYWWPTAPWAHWSLLTWLVVAAGASTYIAGPTAGFINAAIWYGMIMAVRFVALQAIKTRS